MVTSSTDKPRPATGTLYLIPVTLGDTTIERVLPPYNKEIIRSLRHFIVEDVRSARRFLKQTDREIEIDSLTFYLLNKYTHPEMLADYIAPLLRGESVGVISEAGCPAIADPGADIVALAQRRGIKVVPLVGPSSILLALMASGFNGQDFAFRGYLPIEAGERVKALKQAEQRIYTEGQTQLFIETPYRNAKLMNDILQSCRPQTRLCLAAGLTTAEEYIKTLDVGEWRRMSKEILPDLTKIPCIFLLYQ
ncbi:MAG: SAM-dependent methyltransferase [Prevotellaceae bacterium]|jgi:16S rRNA (cytidine1402-2'-O)-methyltransferase|nr:SAM-dependent methyltransferase [Prevotellaceae bacterium]